MLSFFGGKVVDRSGKMADSVLYGLQEASLNVFNGSEADFFKS